MNHPPDRKNRLRLHGHDELLRSEGPPKKAAAFEPYQPTRHYEGLSSIDAAVLALEAKAQSLFPPWSVGVHERHIREGLDLSPSRYYQILRNLLANQHARKAEPIVLRQIEERINRRRIARNEPSLSWDPQGSPALSDDESQTLG
ncbi:DUF3263 domain-containing protein [Streptomyces sp. NPDC020883]|uniref:DUF3263 domain-containing protein n=1 Tax=Streptomyces sp. NPDC020883 TaxID=3365099 RepID=UPI0037B011F9